MAKYVEALPVEQSDCAAWGETLCPGVTETKKMSRLQPIADESHHIRLLTQPRG